MYFETFSCQLIRMQGDMLNSRLAVLNFHKLIIPETSAKPLTKYQH